MPIHAAMTVFDIDEENSRVVYCGCERYKGINDYCDQSIGKAEMCNSNFRTYSKLIWGHEATHIDFWEGEFCLKEVVLGQGRVYDGILAQSAPDTHRGVSARQLRNSVVRHLIDPVPHPPSALRILVLLKCVRSAHPDLCNSITALAQSFGTVEVLCMSPLQSIEQEISYIRKFPLVIAEAGTLAFLSMFCHDGTVLLTIAFRLGLGLNFV